MGRGQRAGNRRLILTLLRLRILSRAALALAAVAALCAQAQAQVFESEEHRFRVATVVAGVKHPWSIAFLPGGDMLFTQRTGELRLVRDGMLLEQPLDGVPDALVRGQGGLQEVAVHPDFEVNRFVYLSYSKAEGGRNTTALVRARLEGDRLHQVQEIFEAEAWSTAPGHFGAKIAFDGNGHLFLSVGDRMARPQGNLESHPAQALGSHAGAIVRLREDGSVPDDNPFAGHPGALPEIWSYGHRNPQGLDYHPATGRLWSTEHGPQGGDELNLILPGLNYGWPVIGFGVNYVTATPIHAASEREGMEQPTTYWTPSIGASGLIVYEGDAFPRWRGDLFAGGLARTHRRLSRVRTDDEGRVVAREPLLQDVYRLRDVRQGPDGFIYLATDDRGGRLTDIVRLEPAD